MNWPAVERIALFLLTLCTIAALWWLIAIVLGALINLWRILS